jgi:hypothetical protein
MIACGAVQYEDIMCAHARHWAKIVGDTAKGVIGLVIIGAVIYGATHKDNSGSSGGANSSSSSSLTGPQRRHQAATRAGSPCPL